MSAHVDLLGPLPKGLTIKLISGWIEAIVEEPQAVRVELHFIPSQAVRLLNHTYRNRDAATDILEFPTASAARDEPEVHLGSILISAEEVERKLGHAPTIKDWQALFTHGIKNLQKYHKTIA